MGIFNKIGSKLGEKVGTFGDKLAGLSERTLVLDFASIDKWPEQVLRHQRLPEAVLAWQKEVEKRAAKVHEAKAKLMDIRLREKKFPERARDLYDEHLPIVRKELDTILKSAEFSNDPLKVEMQVALFQEANTAYQESTRKSITALKEFLAEELAQLNAALRDLEDATIKILSAFDQAKVANVKELARLIQEYKGTRDKEAKLQSLKAQFQEEFGQLEAKKLKIKERIRVIAERAQNPRYKELIAEEEQLHKQEEELRFKGLSSEELQSQLKPIEQRMAFLRKQMINDITALNINEQRGFLDAVKDDLLLNQKKLERVEELLGDLRHDTFKQKFAALVEPFKATLEDSNQIIEGDNVAP